MGGCPHARLLKVLFLCKCAAILPLLRNSKKKSGFSFFLKEFFKRGYFLTNIIKEGITVHCYETPIGR
jgi:hypothetical protein